MKLSVIPPDCDPDGDEAEKTHSGKTKKYDPKRDGDVECSESGEERQKQCCGYYELPTFQAFDDLTNVWDVMFPVERYKFINEVVEKITVHIDRVEIEYKTDGLEAVITEAEAANGKND